MRARTESVEEEGVLSMLLRVSEMQAYLKVSKTTAYTLLRTGAIPFVRVGRGMRVDTDVLHQFVANGGVQSPVRSAGRSGRAA